MSHTTVVRRGRALAVLASAAGLFLGTATVVGAPAAQSAAPAGDCATAFPEADLVKGDAVHGLTVTSGTEPTAFTGEVLGVLADGIAPDLDMIMVRLSSSEIDRVGGIWQGMSGSPVYAADGRLIGAVAYGLSYGPSPVAGVTPYAAMDDYLTAPAPTRIRVSEAQARTIARHSDATASEAAQGFSQLPMPTGVSGISARRLAKADKHTAGHRWMPRDTYAMGASAAPGTGAGPETVVAGGNLAASLSYGDVTQAGVGTATSVCDGKVVGFGHPMSFLGETTLSLHPADAIYIQEESLGAPFKVANLGAPAGTITDDHLTGITGAFGALPDVTDVSSTVTYRDRARTGSSHVSVPQADAGTTFYQLVGNHDRVIDGVIAGSELLSWTITGTDVDGTPFSLAVTDRYASDNDITFESAFDLADFVYSLSSIKGLTIDDITTSSAVDDDNSTWKVSAIQQYRDGAWQVVSGKAPAVGHAGKKLILRAVLTGATGTRTVPVPVTVPQRASGYRGRLGVTGGLYVFSEDAYPRSLAQAQKYVAQLVRNDQVQVELGLFGRDGGKGVEQTSTTAPLDKVVMGRKSVKVVIK